ncbi:MAG: hypothetical protein QOH61_127 [Chloroflexota bacterium]|jgi:hypothetical protein|nr:hypothetical protein [Chloroflexota bacterium]
MFRSLSPNHLAAALLAVLLAGCAGGGSSDRSSETKVPSRSFVGPTPGASAAAAPSVPAGLASIGPALTFAPPSLEPFPTLDTAQRPTPIDGLRPPVRFSRQAVQDPAAGNVDALVFLLPDGWQAQAGVQWLPAWERLAFLQTTVFDPSTGITIDWLPIQDFIWFDPPAGLSAPIGGNYQGKAYVPPATDPVQFVADFWMPNVLPHLRNATLVRVDQVPEIAAEFETGFGGPADAFAYRMRYQYDQGGQAWEEDVSFALLYSAANGITSWYVNFAYTVRAPLGELDRNAGMISTVVASRITTPEWEGIYRLVQQLFIQGIRQQMADTLAFGNLLAQYRAESAALQQQVTEERQASQDRIAELRGQVLQGIETYANPFNQELVQLPVGWSQYWVNAQDEYAVSDPGFDPNGFGGGGWQQLQRHDP